MKLLTERPIILASASPRRRELLQQVGIEPCIVTPQAEELKMLPPGDTGAGLVLENARRKAEAAFALCGTSDALIVAADTVVVCGGRLFGKPHDEQEAHDMLAALSGKTHSVFTGHWLIDAADGRSCGETGETQVCFCPLTEAEIAAYIASGDPLDKAGAYGIQSLGGLFVERISGDYGTVVGLSLPLLYRLIRSLDSKKA